MKGRREMTMPITPRITFDITDFNFEVTQFVEGYGCYAICRFDKIYFGNSILDTKDSPFEMFLHNSNPLNYVNLNRGALKEDVYNLPCYVNEVHKRVYTENLKMVIKNDLYLCPIGPDRSDNNKRLELVKASRDMTFYLNLYHPIFSIRQSNVPLELESGLTCKKASQSDLDIYVAYLEHIISEKK